MPKILFLLVAFLATFGATIATHAAFPTASYMVIDLSGGATATSYPVSHSNTGPDLTNDECRTTKLWLKRIQPGTFTMGSPKNELGHQKEETQHQVRLTQPYYIGVFEVTQKQWQLIMGNNPFIYKGDTRPAECNYETIRGGNLGSKWPRNGGVDADSFIGKLRSKTGFVLDIPTEAQWEYACRARTTTALNTGKNLTATGTCPNMTKAGRYWHNASDGKGGHNDTHTKVGSYLPNAWGLYDMHGNVEEWCLDWKGNYPAGTQTDPLGAADASGRVTRGGSWISGAADADRPFDGDNSANWGGGAWTCRSARRNDSFPSDADFGFRGLRLVALPAVR